MVFKKAQVDNRVTEELIEELLIKKAFVKISVRRIILHDLWLDWILNFKMIWREKDFVCSKLLLHSE